MLQRRFGVFYVARRDLVKDDFRFVLKAMEFVPQIVKHEYADREGNRVDRFKMVGISPMFDELSEADHPPKYDVVVDGRMDDDVKVRVYRMEAEVF